MGVSTGPSIYSGRNLVLSRGSRSEEVVMYQIWGLIGIMFFTWGAAVWASYSEGLK